MAALLRHLCLCRRQRTRQRILESGKGLDALQIDIHCYECLGNFRADADETYLCAKQTRRLDDSDYALGTASSTTGTPVISIQ